MHGYRPGSVTPTTELVFSHKHPDDREHVEDLLDHALHSAGSFSSRHHFRDTSGQEHDVIVVADRMFDETDSPLGSGDATAIALGVLTPSGARCNSTMPVRYPRNCGIATT